MGPIYGITTLRGPVGVCRYALKKKIMKQITSRIATTHVNRRFEMFTRECLEQMAAESNATGGRPQLFSHDWSRVIGWSTRSWVEQMEDGEYALLCETALPETDQERSALQERFHQYVQEIQRQEIEPYSQAIASLHRSSDSAISLMNCVGMVEPDIALTLCGDVAIPDESGLVPLSRLKPVAGGLFLHGKYLLAPHWMMRRFAYRLNSMNDVFVGELKIIDDETDLSCRICLDGDFVGFAESRKMYAECDYWWGKPFTGNLLKQPTGVLCHGANERLSALEMLRRTEMYLYRRGGETVVQIEEIHSAPVIRPFGDEQYAIERYAHMIMDSAGAIIHLDGSMRLYSAETWQKRQQSAVTLENAPKAEHRLKMFAVDGVTDQKTAFSVISSFFKGNPLVPETFGVKMEDGD